MALIPGVMSFVVLSSACLRNIESTHSVLLTACECLPLLCDCPQDCREIRTSVSLVPNSASVRASQILPDSISLRRSSRLAMVVDWLRRDDLDLTVTG